jgi:predicted transcriptional regulator
MDITPEILKEYLEKKGQKPQHLARLLHVSPSTVSRWLDGKKPTGTSAAILGLLIYSEGLVSREKKDEWTKKGMTLYSRLIRAVGKNEDLQRDLEHIILPRTLRESQDEEVQLIGKMINEAMVSVAKAHNRQRKLMKELVSKARSQE